MIYLNETRDINIDEWTKISTELGVLERLATAKTVVIKPNFAAGTYVNPSIHVVSDLLVLKDLINFIVYINPQSRIFIAESDSTGYGFAFLKFEHLGIPENLDLQEDVAKQVDLLDMSRDRLVKIQNPLFKHFISIDSQLWLSEQLMNADFKISLSNLKTHSVTGYTGACKNLFGCLPTTDKSIYHPHIHSIIHDLTLAIKPDLNIVDAFYGMERNGPVQGIDVDTGYRVFSDNSLDADVYASQTAGIKPQSVKYLKYLLKTSDNTVTTAIINDNMKPYRKPQLFLRVMNRIGLCVQRVGEGIAKFGHRIHSCNNIFVLGITLIRPILLKLFDYEELKSMKRKIFK